MKGWPGEPDMDYDVLVADGEAAANAGKPITDVIFDFGNVLIYWDQRPDGRRHQHRRGHRHHAP